MVQRSTRMTSRFLRTAKPQTITSFQHQDIPISIGILVDNSGSMRTKRQAVNQAALDLVRASNPDDETFVVNFSDEAYIDQDFTGNINKLRDGFRTSIPRAARRFTTPSWRRRITSPRTPNGPKQVLLVITDGEDNASSTTLEETVRRIQDLQGPVVYSIGLLYDDMGGGGRETHRAGARWSCSPNETGGLAFFPKNLEQVDEIAGRGGARYPRAVHDGLSLHQASQPGRLPRGPGGSEGKGI